MPSDVDNGSEDDLEVRSSPSKRQKSRRSAAEATPPVVKVSSDEESDSSEVSSLKCMPSAHILTFITGWLGGFLHFPVCRLGRARRCGS